ncbi:MAG: TatD family hydrolase [Pseudomonadales bacterium]|nr:TatD family hydrolase [Pseudomonadales bacterium]
MKIFDTHCHYNIGELRENWQEFWQEAQKAGVEKTLIVGCNPEGNKDAIVMSATDDNLYCSIGTHPGRLAKISGSYEEKLKYIDEIVQENDILIEKNLNKVIAIGETGLDFYRSDKNNAAFDEEVNLQIILFKKQIVLAKKYNLPIILHIRDKKVDLQSPHNTYNLVLNVIAEENLENHPLIFHCYSGNKEFMQKIIKFPQAYFSFAGNITYPNTQDMQESLEIAPKDRIMVETDAPFLAPQKYRGDFCHPSYIVETVTFIEEKFGVSPDMLYNNALRLFNK